MIKPKLTKVDGNRFGILQSKVMDEYDLHWNNNFVKVGLEYCTKIKHLTPKAREVFDDLVHTEMNMYNTLRCVKTGYAINSKDIENKYNITPRRRREILNELIIHGFIGIVEIQGDKSIVVNPMIASKSKSLLKSILMIFADYYIETLGKKVFEQYDFSVQTYNESLEYEVGMEEHNNAR